MVNLLGMQACINCIPGTFPVLTYTQHSITTTANPTSSSQSSALYSAQMRRRQEHIHAKNDSKRVISKRYSTVRCSLPSGRAFVSRWFVYIAINTCNPTALIRLIELVEHYLFTCCFYPGSASAPLGLRTLYQRSERLAIKVGMHLCQ